MFLAKLISLLFVIVALVATAFGPPTPQEDEPIAGIINRVEGEVFLRKGKGGNEEPIDKQSVARLLLVGEQLRCGRRGKVQILLCKGESWETRTVEGPSVIGISPEHKCRNQEELRELVRRGGRDRGLSSPIFSPANGAVISLSDLAVRWVPTPNMQNFSLSLFGVGEGVIWTHEVKDAKSGFLPDLTIAKLRSTLERFKESEKPFTLRLQEPTGGTSTVTFSVLSTQRQRSLAQRLSVWETGPDDVMRHLGRAGVYVHFEMLSNATEEYELALAKAPTSLSLLRRTIEAHRRVGNSLREQQLKLRLRPH